MVVDVDNFHDHGQAAKICKDNGIELVISNPCFEVWLFDHISICPSSFTLTSIVESAVEKAGISKGNRGKDINAKLIDSGHISNAMHNAERHTQWNISTAAIGSYHSRSRNTLHGPTCQQ